MKKTIELLKNLKKEKVNIYSPSYWSPVYFHAYTSLVEGFWFRDEADYKELQQKIKGLPNFEAFKTFCYKLKETVMRKGYKTSFSPACKDWDNKVAISLLGKKDEVLYIGFVDHKLCIGTNLISPMCSTDNQAFEIND